jgi:predicted metal-dependent hydrolase
LGKKSIVPRKIVVGFDPDIPKYWCNGSAFMSHMLNTYSLLVPDNENYYIRHLSGCIDQIRDNDLVESLQNFCRQEAQHGKGHKAYWKNLDAQGIRYRRFVGMVGWFNYKLLEPIIPRSIHLANIACIEHINAYIGSLFLKKNLLENSDPELKLLFNWHFAEEIEHKAVAYDVFEHLSGNYALRLLSSLLVFPLFYTINTVGTLYLLWQDKRFFCLSTWQDLGRFLFKNGALLHTLRNIFAYLKPGFHPSQIDDYALANRFLSAGENKAHLRAFPTA